MADVFSRWALQTCVKYLPRVAKNPDDREARRQMLLAMFFFSFSPDKLPDLIVGSLASSFAGIGFGNAGVHLCHGISYPVMFRFCPEHPRNAHFHLTDLGLEQETPQVQASRLRC